MDIGIVIVVCLLGGVIAGLIGWSKHNTGGAFVGFFILGALLPLIGIIAAAVSKGPKPVPQPPGWYTDPWGQAALRWFDGREWTWQTHEQQPA